MIRESTEESETKRARSCSRRHSSRSTLFPIQVLDEDVTRQHEVKVHCIGFSKKYDEWICKSQIQYKPVLVPPSPSQLEVSRSAIP